MNDLNVFLLTGVASTEGFAVAVALISAFLLIRREWNRVRTFLLAAVGLALSTWLIKLAVAAPRPEGALVEVTGYAFPSGHAAGIAFLALSACILASRLPLVWRYLAYAAAIALAVAIGTSRIYFSVHTPLQMFAGYTLGVLWALGWYLLSRRHR